MRHPHGEAAEPMLFRQLAQLLTGRSEAKRQRKTLLTPLLEKLRQRQA